MNRDLVALRARLESLGVKTGFSERVPRPAWPAPSARLPPGCDLEETPYGSVAVRRERIAGFTRQPLRKVSSCLELVAEDLERPLFLDTETTGLAGGTGTVAFMVGLAWPDGGEIALAQYFLCDLDQEKALLWAVGQRLSEHGALVTYNGRTFDWPLLQTRLIMMRQRTGWPSLPHLDLLGLVRRIFKPRLPDCALRTIEEAVLSVERDEDLPGSLIPSRYFGWLRGGTADSIEAIFAHNRQDLLSMPALLAELERILEDATDLHPLDRFSRARFLESRGLRDEALNEYAILWERRAGLSQQGALGLRFAGLLRRSGEWRGARAVLEECWRTQAYPYRAAIELAKLLEHDARDLPAAYRLVCDALALLRVAVVMDDRWHLDLQKRRQRLDRRLNARSELRLTLTG